MKNLKALLEKRAEYQQTMDSLVNTADTENRAMTEEEVRKLREALNTMSKELGEAALRIA